SQSAEITSEKSQTNISSFPQRDLEISGIEPINAPQPLEIVLAPYSYSREGSVDFQGSDLSVAITVDNRSSIVVDATRHEARTAAPNFNAVAAGKARIWTYRVGPKFSWRPNERVTVFGYSLIGGVRF